MKKVVKSIFNFIQKEVVFSIALVMAVVSMFLVPPDKNYIHYIDYKVIVLLFCLMAVVAGMQKLGVFTLLGRKLTVCVSNRKYLNLILVLLCFFSSMLITNDVALITFVPFTIVIFAGINDEAALIKLIVLETIAANVGSVLTPIGNPQNLYLYSLSKMGVSHFVMCMLPIAGVSLIVLVILTLVTGNTKVGRGVASPEDERITKSSMDPKEAGVGKILSLRFWVYFALFVVCLLNVFHLIPYYIVLLVVVAGIIVTDYKLLLKVDYILLLTFVCFFVFVGNIKAIESVSTFLKGIVEGREVLTGVIVSQGISNVPAAMLLSGFTDKYEALLYGTNIGGLGTLIASMASLISYKFYSQRKTAQKGKYMLVFTVYNVMLLFILLAVAKWRNVL